MRETGDESERVLDPRLSPNIMTEEAALAIIKAGFLKPKDKNTASQS